VLPGVDAAAVQDRTREALDSFSLLPGTAEEVRTIAERYRRARRDEAAEVWEGAEASEARLQALSRPPRVLHLATHGFYRRASAPQDRPLLLAGVALAGANRALREAGQDGILYAIEAQSLNLEGTELVVLSACETAQGQIDYGEGVSGLVRALRTAGARHVLVTLRPVADQGASAFMQRFYHHWLGQQGRSDPAAAFRAAQREAIGAVARGESKDQTWAQFALIGG
jgi:CHAT domain-containing protein